MENADLYSVAIDTTLHAQSDAVQRILGDFMRTLLEAGMGTEEAAKQGFALAEVLRESLPIGEPLATPAFADKKLKAARLLKEVAQSIGIDLESQQQASQHARMRNPNILTRK